MLQLLELFGNSISLTELEEMDLPLLSSRIEARIRQIGKREEAQAKAREAAKRASKR